MWHYNQGARPEAGPTAQEANLAYNITLCTRGQAQVAAATHAAKAACLMGRSFFYAVRYRFTAGLRQQGRAKPELFMLFASLYSRPAAARKVFLLGLPWQPQAPPKLIFHQAKAPPTKASPSLLPDGKRAASPTKNLPFFLFN